MGDPNQPAPDALRFRQVHLDFHTSGDIRGVGADFDPDRFADTMAAANVDSVTVFARCHHGNFYYPSKKHPQFVHPHLAVPDLLNKQIEALHRRGIRAPIYTTIQWDERLANDHRDWLCVDVKGQLYDTPPLQPGFYQFLDVFHPDYRQFLFDHVKDIFDCVPAVDGFFFDITQPRASLAKYWLVAMEEAGLDPEDEYDRTTFAQKVMDDWKQEMTQYVREFSDDCTVFYNAGHVGPRDRAAAEAFSHFEMESLPSGGWGYLHFPLAARYTRTLARQTGRDTMGMTGKFHTSWGDFSSYKNPAALQFECFHMLALGSKCSIGDQLPPRGALDKPTYDLIGPVYGRVKSLEPWCRGATSVCEIGLLTPEEFSFARGGHAAQSARQPTSAMGALRMFQELSLQFDILDSRSEFDGYKILVLPDDIPVDERLAGRLQKHLDNGGAILASHHSGMDPEGQRFTFDALGVTSEGEAPYSPDFLVPGKTIGKDLPASGHVMYERAMHVKPMGSAQVLAEVEVPYFNRTWRHFCSHRHTPSRGEIGYAGVVRNGRCIYFAHPIFRQYQANAPRWCKTFVADAIDLLLGGTEKRLVAHDGPSTLITSLMRQPHESRHVLHLLHYVPERRGEFDVIEDIFPLHDLTVTLNVPGIKRARLVEKDQTLSLESHDAGVRFTVPKLTGYAVVELS